MVSIGSNIALNIPFIMKWGALGAAWATLLAGLISGSIYFLVSQHYYEIRWEYKNIGLILWAQDLDSLKPGIVNLLYSGEQSLNLAEEVFGKEFRALLGLEDKPEPANPNKKDRNQKSPNNKLDGAKQTGKAYLK